MIRLAVNLKAARKYKFCLALIYLFRIHLVLCMRLSDEVSIFPQVGYCLTDLPHCNVENMKENLLLLMILFKI